jgi:hypothetical protein
MDKWIMGFIASPELAETLALRRAVSIAADWGYDKIIVV